MVFQRVTFERLFKPAGSCFGFESEGNRYFDVVVPGHPRIEEGMTVIALLESKNTFCNNGLLGWIDCKDGSIACDSFVKHTAWCITSAYFSVMFPIRAYAIIERPTVADFVALFTAVMFSASSIFFLYSAAKAFVVKKALIKVRNASNLAPPPPA
jgi:hypothetical protein